MELALYDDRLGYYARAARRSGRAGDFFTSVDVGPVFGDLLAVQIAEMAGLLGTAAAESHPSPGHTRSDHSQPSGAAPIKPTHRSTNAGRSAEGGFRLGEAGGGNGRLAADILRALGRRDPLLYARTRLHLVEAS